MVASAYWVRHDRAPIGHRGRWTSHVEAVRQSARLIAAARKAAVGRLVWTSIANPGLDPDLSYYEGKAVVEQLVAGTGMPHAILRPTCCFGHNGLPIENIVWAVRRMPVFPIPSGSACWIRPIHVEDYARTVADAVESADSAVRDVCGPDRLEFRDLARRVRHIVKGRGPGRAAFGEVLCCGVQGRVHPLERDDPDAGRARRPGQKQAGLDGHSGRDDVASRVAREQQGDGRQAVRP